MTKKKTGSGLGPVKTLKHYNNNSLKEDPEDSASVGDDMENACRHLLERKKFSGGGAWCISVLLSLTALYPILGMSICSPWNIPSCVPGLRESHGCLNCHCTQGSTPQYSSCMSKQKKI